MLKKTAIICAGDREVKPFLESITNPQITKKAMLRFYEGFIDDVPVVTLYSGVCKVNAAIATQILIDAFQVDIVINAGTAGGMAPGIHLLDTVVTVESAYYDVDAEILTEFHPWLTSIYFQSDARLVALAKDALKGNELIPGKVWFGRTITGEKFIEDNRRDEINACYSPLSVDMETASIAHVCHVNNIPFIAIRAITDTAEHAGIKHFEQNCKKAAEVSRDMVIAVLKRFPQER